MKELIYTGNVAGLQFKPAYHLVKTDLKTGDPLVLKVNKENPYESHEKGAIEVYVPMADPVSEGDDIQIGFIPSKDLTQVHIILENYETEVICYNHNPENKPWERVTVGIYREVEDA